MVAKRNGPFTLLAGAFLRLTLAWRLGATVGLEKTLYAAGLCGCYAYVYYLETGRNL